MKINLLIFLTFVFSSHKVNGYCFYDGSSYNFEGEFIFTHKSYWLCWSSYVEVPKSNNNLDKNAIVLTFSNLEIDCANSFLRIDDQNNNILDYCESYPKYTKFIYVTRNSSKIVIEKKGTLKAALYVQFMHLPNQPNITISTTSTVPTEITTQQTSTNVIETSTHANSNCGVPGIRPDETNLDKVVGGTPAIPKSWPWQVLLTDYRFLCGGSLINKEWIVTAAHCQFYLNTLFADLGEYNVRNVTDNTIRVKVEKFIRHPQFDDPFNTFEYDYDIALIKLRTPVTFTNSISPICMPNGRTPELGSVGITTGWGRTNESASTISNVLRQTTITVVEKTLCSRYLRTNRQICAGNTDPIHSSCKGDSGGPFALRESNAYYLSGVVSSGYDGCSGRTIYTNVAEFESWIAETITNN